MKIEVIPSVLSLEEVNKLLLDIDPKTNATDMKYFVAPEETYGIKKIKCTEHEIIKLSLHRLNINESSLESASIVYYPTGSYNAPHADNCSIDNGVVTKHKDWTHTGIIFLNSEFTGGELVYPNQGCVFYPTIGTMVITPAGEQYIHYVNKVLTGERFTLVFRFV